jgi:hypothetical protein
MSSVQRPAAECLPLPKPPMRSPLRDFPKPSAKFRNPSAARWRREAAPLLGFRWFPRACTLFASSAATSARIRASQPSFACMLGYFSRSISGFASLSTSGSAPFSCCTTTVQRGGRACLQGLPIRYCASQARAWGSPAFASRLGAVHHVPPVFQRHGAQQHAHVVAFGATVRHAWPRISSASVPLACHVSTSRCDRHHRSDQARRQPVKPSHRCKMVGTGSSRRDAPGRRPRAAARHRPVVAQPTHSRHSRRSSCVAVAQRQPFRQVVGVGTAQQCEAFRACREGRYLGVIPAGGMTPIRLVVRQPMGPISGRRGHLADEGRARCAVSFRRPHDAEASSSVSSPAATGSPQVPRRSRCRQPTQVLMPAPVDLPAASSRSNGGTAAPCAALTGTSGDAGDTAPALSFSASVTWGQAGDTWGQAAGTATTRSAASATAAGLSPLVPAPGWASGDAQTRVDAGVPVVPTCPRAFAAGCASAEKSSFIRRPPTCS